MLFAVPVMLALAGGGVMGYMLAECSGAVWYPYVQIMLMMLVGLGLALLSDWPTRIVSKSMHDV